ncbi:MAG: hypothetical protein IH886_00960 [Nitrospinae bacterium]|nr:hypothetical protein [Nitrospinota bacterium]
MTAILCLFLIAPVFADGDSVQQIVQDYKQIESLFKSGHMNQVDHRNALSALQKRAVKEIEKSAFKLKDGRTLYIGPTICETEQCRLFIKIWSGFTEDSA